MIKKTTIQPNWSAIHPPAKPFAPPLFLYHFLRNPLRCLPQSVYEEPIVPYKIGKLHIAWVTDPKLTEKVFLGANDEFPKQPLEMRVFSSPLGKSILTSQGEDWKWQRKAVSGLFRHSEILGYVPDMVNAAENLLQRWRHPLPSATRNIDRDVTSATYEAITHTLFGGETMPEAMEIQKAVDVYLNSTSWEIAATLAGAPNWGWHPATGRLKRASKAMRGAVNRLLDRWQANGTHLEDHLLGHLLEVCEPGMEAGISRNRLVNNLLTFLNAGHETTGKALIWTLFILSHSPEWQDRLREEVWKVAVNNPISGEHIEQLTLTRQVFEESMRLYAPAPVLTRLVTEDCVLGGVHLPKGALIFIPIWAVHRHRKLWDEPEQFRPERFEPDVRKSIPRTQYLPFGFGPRICIGATFARVEGIAMLATMLRKARFEWPGGRMPEPLARVTLWPRGGMSLKVSMLHA